jgi:hypothetical protein
MAMSDTTANIWELLADLCCAAKQNPVKDKVWEHRVDDAWWLCVNGFQEAQEVLTPSGVRQKVSPFSCYVEFNGWPAGVFDLTAGTFADGVIANCGSFINAVRDKTKILIEAHR